MLKTRILCLLLLLLLIAPGGCGRAGDESAEKPQTEEQETVQPEPEQRPEEQAEDEGEKDEDKTEEILAGMTTEEKIAQLFIVQPEALTDVDVVVAAGETTKAAINEYPVGGFVYLQGNLTSAEQVKDMLRNVQAYSRERIGLPMFLCVDEEGGKVSRIAGSGAFDVPVFENISDIGARGDVEEVRNMGETIGSYLSELGFNVDFAPVADVLSNPDSTVIKDRSFGTDPELVGEMAAAFSDGLHEAGICSTFKHFPGHGAVEGDTHEGYAYTSKTLEELRECELRPFQRGIEAGADFIMTAHISLPGVSGDDTPASMSGVMISQVLRQEMGYDGIVVTDALNMGAVTQNYTSAEAAKSAILAGADMILMPEDFHEAYNGLLEAVRSGEITEERIDESLRRIIRLKSGKGL